MKALLLTGIRQLIIADVPEPQISGAKDVKIKMNAVGICGSDIHYYNKGRIGSQVVNYPFTVGHEGAGTVVGIGPEVRKVKAGDKVAIEPAMPCGVCDQCLSGRQHTCRNLRYLGCPGQAEGCLMEFIIMPESSCFPLPFNLTPDHGSISEPLSIGLYSIKKSGNISRAAIGIFGFGPIGLSVALSAKAVGTGPFYITDKIGDRLSIASAEGALLTLNPLKNNIVYEIMKSAPLGLDVVFECCGQQEALDQAVEVLKPGGKLVVIGIPEFNTWSLDVQKTRRKEISLQFIRRQVDCVSSALEMMSTGEINISRMITHRFAFSEAKDAFNLVASYSDGVMKAMIDF